MMNIGIMIHFKPGKHLAFFFAHLAQIAIVKALL